VSLGALGRWFGHGRRRLCALGAVGVAIVVALLIAAPSGGGVSPGRMEELIDSSYKTSGARCVASAHGRDTCKLKAGSCSGTLVVAAVGNGTFTIVNAVPEQLASSTCNRGEGIEGEAE
jgi:hypothetical protein